MERRVKKRVDFPLTISQISGATDRNSPSDIYEPSSEEVISESGSSPDGSLNPSQSTKAHNSGNKVVISGFDLDRIHHTKDICTDRLSERIAEQARQQLEQENEKIMEDVKECKSLAVEAGYGEWEGTDNIFIYCLALPSPTFIKSLPSLKSEFWPQSTGNALFI